MAGSGWIVDRLLHFFSHLEEITREIEMADSVINGGPRVEHGTIQFAHQWAGWDVPPSPHKPSFPLALLDALITSNTVQHTYISLGRFPRLPSMLLSPAVIGRWKTSCQDGGSVLLDFGIVRCDKRERLTSMIQADSRGMNRYSVLCMEAEASAV